MLFSPLDSDFLGEGQLGQVLPGTLPKGLLALRGIDTHQSDFVLLMAGIQYCQRIAIRDPDYPSDEFFGLYGEGETKPNDAEHPLHS